MAYFKGSTTTGPTREAIEVSAKALHKWLSQSESLLREVLDAFSVGGLFYTADVTRRLLQAFVEHGGGDEASLVAAACTRDTPIVAAASSETGLERFR